MGQAVSRADPALAYRLASYDGRNAARLSFVLSQADVSADQRRRADRLARGALAREPLAVTAISTLATNASIAGDDARATRLFGQALTLSRRDLRTQLWMIEAAVARGDVAGAVHQYDITLRVLPTTSDLLYPVLIAAAADANIRRPLVRALATRPTWAESFVSYVAEKGADPQVSAMLFRDLDHVGVGVPSIARAAVVDALLTRGQHDAAWTYYASIRRGIDRRRSRDPHFDLSLGAPSRLDWKPIEDGRTFTSVQNRVVDFSAPSSVGGPLLAQVQLLPPGDYVLHGRSSGVDQLEQARPYWTLMCEGGRELGRVTLPNSSGSSVGTFAGSFHVPAGCPAQTLLLVAQPSDAAAGLSGQIGSVELEPGRSGATLR